MRYTGLSGIDTESMVTALMKAEGLKLDKLKRENQLTLWKQTAYQNTSDVMRSFTNNFLSLVGTNSARLASSYLKNNNTVKNASGADSSAVNIISSGNAEPGSYTMDVKKLAQTDVYSGASGSATGEIKSSVDWNDPASYQKLKAGDSIRIALDGNAKTITFRQEDIEALQSSGTPAQDFETMLQTKLTAQFGSESIGGGAATPKIKATIDGGGNLQITANKGHTATIQGGGSRDTSVTGSGGISLSFFDPPIANPTPAETLHSLTVNENGVDKTITFKTTTGMTAEDLVNAINKGISEAADADKIDSGLKATLVGGELKFNVGSTSYDVTVSDASGNPGVMNALGFDSSSKTMGATNVLSDFGFTAGDSTKLDVSATLKEAFGISGDTNFLLNGINFTFGEDETIQELMNKVNEAKIGVKMSFDSLNESFRLESTSEGSANSIIYDDTDGFLTGSMGLSRTQEAQDALFVFNGIETTRESNNIEIAGINMKLTAITSDAANAPVNGGPITINVEKDVAGTMEFIKSFIQGYNDMIDGLNKELNTSRPKRDSYNYYEPLTDEQKESMSDRDIENWEKQAQTGMLNNDELLRGVNSSLRSMLYTPVELENGTKISLYEIGITTGDYSSGGKLIIDETKLRTALETRGEDIADLFTKSSDITYKSGYTDPARIRTEGIAERMNDIINNAIGTNGSITNRAGIKGDSILEMSSTMYKTIKDQNDKMAEMLTYLQNKETSYYEMFSRMEQAITAANNQMSYLQSQLG
jgi:flagellar hook-associated protein 2